MKTIYFVTTVVAWILFCPLLLCDVLTTWWAEGRGMYPFTRVCVFCTRAYTQTLRNLVRY